MAASDRTRLALLEEQVAQLRKRVSRTPEQEVAWRLWRAADEQRIEATVRVREQEALIQSFVADLEGFMAEMEGLALFLSKPREATQAEVNARYGAGVSDLSAETR
jgi:hypothetical protein